MSGVNKRKARGDRGRGKVNETGMREALADYCVMGHEAAGQSSLFALVYTLQGRSIFNYDHVFDVGKEKEE